MYKFIDWHTRSDEQLCFSCGSNCELYKLEDELKCGECIANLEEMENESQ